MDRLPLELIAHLKRANRMLRKLRTYLGRVIRDIGRKIEATAGTKRRLRGCYYWRGACASSISAGPRSIPCMRRRSNTSARAASSSSM
jgi:hypothetical protein